MADSYKSCYRMKFHILGKVITKFLGSFFFISQNSWQNVVKMKMFAFALCSSQSSFLYHN